MAMTVGQDSGDSLVSTINTTPLVDVMLVLLIIFLITIPVATHTVPVALPEQTQQRYDTQPETISLSITQDGTVYWDARPIGQALLLERLKGLSQQAPQPPIQIHGDADASYAPVGQVVLAAQKAGIRKLSFITEPQANP